MMILVTLVIKKYSVDSLHCLLLDIENESLADEICQSYPFDLANTPLGSSYRKYHLQIALSVVVTMEKREWIVEVMKNGTGNV
jgi:hypothetical protein